MTKRALLLINRHSRRGKESFAQAVDRLHDHNFALTIIPTQASQEIPQIIHQHKEKVDLVIIGGGDGTLNIAVDSLVATKLPLGILPLGTANDLARTLNIPLSIPKACDLIAEGNTKHIDLGWVNGKHFFNVASLGLSVKITEKLAKGAKRRFGALAYALTASQVISQTRRFNAKICLNGECVKVKTIQIAIGNGRYYGGGMAIAHDAAIDDQRLDLYSLEIESWWQIFPLLRRLPQGKQALLPWVRTIESQEIEIITNKPYAINTDGELTTVTPAKFKVVPHGIEVFAPSTKP